jgi:predicted DCC family thiol-disulfide oxidoreductase YuxK
MAWLAAQPRAGFVGPHLVLYDGVCGLCNGILRFLLRHDRRGVFRFASLQSATGRSIVERCGGNPDAMTSFYVVASYQTAAARVVTRSDAVAFVAGQLGWPWKAGWAIRFVPRVLRDRAYDVVARTRYRVFGRLDHCPLPRPEFRSRFIA